MEGVACTLERPLTLSALICTKWCSQKKKKIGALVVTIILPRVPYYLQPQFKLQGGSKIDFFYSYMHVKFMCLSLDSSSSIRKTDLPHLTSCTFVVLSRNTVMFFKVQTAPEIYFLFDFCVRPLETSSLALYISLWRLGTCLLREQSSIISFRSSPHFY